MPIELHESFAIHPGLWLLEEIVRPRNMNLASAAKHLGVAGHELNLLLNGEAALTPDMAARFEAGFGVSAATMLRMQATYDLVQAKRRSDTL